MNYSTRYRGARFEWTKDHDALLGTMSDEQLARQLKISRLAVYNRRKFLAVKAWGKTHQWSRCSNSIKWSKIDPLLGTMSDEKIAHSFNTSVHTIALRRHELRIAPVIKPVDVNWDLVPLGLHPDHEIAKALNVTRTTVWAERNKRHIAPYKMIYGFEPCVGHDWITIYRKDL